MKKKKNALFYFFRMHVRLKADGSVPAKGFKASYEWVSNNKKRDTTNCFPGETRLFIFSLRAVFSSCKKD